MPAPAAGEVLIRVEAAGIARADLMQRAGKYPPPAGASDIPGLDVSGVVEQTGGDGDTFKRGDRVCADMFKPGDRVCAILAGGGYAEYVTAPVEQVLPTPENWSSVEAATLPENLFTVFDNVITRANLAPGETLLVHGGTSGIGSTAIMLARMIGAVPYATAGSDEKCEAAVGFGAEAAINYKQKDFVAEIQRLTDGRGVDVVLEMVGASYLERNIDSLAPEGRITTVATQGGYAASLDLRKLMAKRARIMGSTMRARSAAQKGAVRDRLLETVWPRLADKRWIRPVMDSTFPLREASKAHQRMEAGGHIGKIVLVVA